MVEDTINISPILLWTHNVGLKDFVGLKSLTMEIINLGSSQVGIQMKKIIQVGMNSEDIFDAEFTLIQGQCNLGWHPPNPKH